MAIKKIDFNIQNNLSLDQKLLLKACLEEGFFFLESWNKWKDCINIDTIDSQSYFLLPLLYHNLLAHKIDDNSIYQLKGIYRRSWFYNQLILEQLREILICLSNNQIDYIVLGDIAINFSLYENLGDRYIQTLELFIFPEMVPKVTYYLEQLGWTLRKNNQKSLFRRSANNLVFANKLGHQLIVRWQLDQTFLNKDLMEQTIAIQAYNLDILVLNSLAQLTTILSKIKFLNNNNYPLFWLADIIFILQKINITKDFDFSIMTIKLQSERLAIPFNQVMEIINHLEIVEPPLDLKIYPLSITRNEQSEWYWRNIKRKLAPIIRYYRHQK